MTTPHLIDNAIFDTSIAGAAISDVERAEIDGFIQRDLVRVIDEVLDEADAGLRDPGGLVRLDRLEIDLGEIARREYRLKMPEKLRKGLLQALEDARVSDDAATEANRVVNRLRKAHSPLFYFLRHGSLPWYARIPGDKPMAGFDSLDSLLTEALDSSPESLIEFLRNNGDRVEPLERLANQFSPPLLRRVADLLGGSPAAAAQPALDRLASMLPLEEGERASGNESASIGSGVGGESLRDRSPADRDQHTGAGLDRKTPVGRPGEDRPRAERDADSAPDSGQDTAASGPLDDRGAALRDAVHEPAREERDPRPIGEVHGRLVAALLADANQSLDDLWKPMLIHNRRLLEQTLRHHGLDVAVRRRIATGLSASKQAELLGLVEPEAQAWLSSLLRLPELFRSRATLSDTERPPSPSELMEYTLGYLLVERGSRFERPAFLRSLLRQIAAARGQRPMFWLARMRRNLDELGERQATVAWVRQLASLLAEMDSAAATGSIAASTPRESIDLPRPGRPVDGTPDNAHAGNRPGVQGGATDGPGEGDGGEPTRRGEALQPAGSSEVRAPDESILATWRVVDSRVIETEVLPPYRRFARLEAVLTGAVAFDRFAENRLLADLKSLRIRDPWLLQRLLRELQAGGVGRVAPGAGMSREFLSELCFALLSLNSQASSEQPFGSAVELVDAIRKKAGQAADPVALFRNLLGSLIDGDLIDLDAISAPAGEAAPAPAIVDSTIDSNVDAKTESLREVPAETEDLHFLSGMALAAARRMLQCAEILVNAAQLARPAISAERLVAIKWRYLRDHVDRVGPLFNEARFVSGFVDRLTREAGVDDVEAYRASLSQALLQNILSVTRDLARRLVEIVAAGPGEAPRYVESSPVPQTDPDTMAEPREEVHVANAGLVLLAPYLPTLFERLGLVENSEFVERAAAERAVHCLEFLVNESLASPEYRLVLNKLLCGVKPGRPIRRGIDLDDGEREQLEALLLAVTQHWKPLENTSLEGLRESFLQRGGRLRLEGDSWRLGVETRAYDLLLDQLPWSFETIKFTWMDRVIFVKWR